MGPCYGTDVSLRATLAICLGLLCWSPASQASSTLRLDTSLLIEVAGIVDQAQRPMATLASLPLTPVLDALAAGRAPTVPAHYAWVERDTRAFWYAAGASAVTTLGVHILGGLPTLVFGGTVVQGMLSSGLGFPTVTAVALGLFLTYTAAESAVTALVATHVFNSLSTTYEAHYLSGFLAHFAGGVASTAVTMLTFGGGLLLFHGVGLLSEFTGSAGISSLQIFSFLGAMPAVVVAGTALIAVPALATAWALAAGATPRAGYAIDEQWQSPVVEGAIDPTRTIGAVAVQRPMTFALPLP